MIGNASLTRIALTWPYICYVKTSNQIAFWWHFMPT